MIRRWSSLNLINFSLLDYKFLFSRSKIIAFRSSVLLRRFNSKLTKFKRKTLSKWKRRSLRYIYVNLFKNWSFSYKFNRNFYKFQFLENLFIFSFFFFYYNDFRKSFFIESPQTALLAASLNKRFYFYFYPRSFSRYSVIYRNFLTKYGISSQVPSATDPAFLLLGHQGGSSLFYSYPDLTFDLNINFLTTQAQLLELYKINLLLFLKILKLN